MTRPELPPQHASTDAALLDALRRPRVASRIMSVWSGEAYRLLGRAVVRVIIWLASVALLAWLKRWIDGPGGP